MPVRNYSTVINDPLLISNKIFHKMKLCIQYLNSEFSFCVYGKIASFQLLSYRISQIFFSRIKHEVKELTAAHYFMSY